jgi:hypothetical protein
MWCMDFSAAMNWALTTGSRCSTLRWSPIFEKAIKLRSPMKDGPNDGKRLEFKAKVAMEALQVELNAAQLATNMSSSYPLVGNGSWYR